MEIHAVNHEGVRDACLGANTATQWYCPSDALSVGQFQKEVKESGGKES